MAAVSAAFASMVLVMCGLVVSVRGFWEAGMSIEASGVRSQAVVVQASAGAQRSTSGDPVQIDPPPQGN